MLLGFLLRDSLADEIAQLVSLAIRLGLFEEYLSEMPFLGFCFRLVLVNFGLERVQFDSDTRLPHSVLLTEPRDPLEVRGLWSLRRGVVDILIIDAEELIVPLLLCLILDDLGRKRLFWSFFQHGDHFDSHSWRPLPVEGLP